MEQDLKCFNNIQLEVGSASWQQAACRHAVVRQTIGNIPSDAHLDAEIGSGAWFLQLELLRVKSDLGV